MTLGILCSNSSNVFLPKPSIQLLLQEREIFKSLEKIKHFKDALGEQHHLPHRGNKTSHPPYVLARTEDNYEINKYWRAVRP